MKDVFSKILSSRPNTFVTFGNVPVSSGFSPIPFTETSLLYRTEHIVPGSLSKVAYGSGNLTFNGRVCKSPLDGGLGSVEIIRSPPPDAYQDVSETVIDIPGVLSVTRVSSSANTGSVAEYSIIGPDWSLTNESGASTGTEHVVLNINGRSVSIIVNGESSTIEIPSTSTAGEVSQVKVLPSAGGLWGVAIRPLTLSTEYIEEMCVLLKSHPQASEADAPFESVSFRFDKSALRYEALIKLEDINFEEDPMGPLMYSGADVDFGDVSVEQDNITGSLDALNIDSISNVVSECKGLSYDLVCGEASEEESHVIELDYHHLSPVVPLNKTVNGDPRRISISVPESSSGETERVDLNLYMMPEAVEIVCETDPNRVATLSSTSAISGWTDSAMFDSGLWGEAFIEMDTTDADPQDPDDTDPVTDIPLPEAYGSWVLVSRAGNIATATGSFSISISATRTLTSTGLSSVYVDGSLYTAGSVLTKGWHFISFVPTTKVNKQIAIGASGASRNVIASFSIYYATSPSTYMNTVYRNYVDPVAITSGQSDSMSISEGATRVYEHDWSISAAD